MKLFRRVLRVLALLLPAWLGIAVCEAQTPPTRIMPLGDSLTSGTTVVGAYRNKLHELLTTAGYNVDFVGTQTDAANPGLPDGDHQGMGGYRIDQIQSGIPTWLDSVADPDVILLMIGTNDFSAGFNTATAQTRLACLVEDIAARRPHAKIILSNLPLRTDNAGLEALQSVYNAAIPGIVSDQVALGREVSFLDMHSALEPGDFEEGVHPSTAGYQKMAETWLPAITSVITPSGTSNPPVILRASAVDSQHVSVTFSKPLADSAANPANFFLSGGVPVSQATLDPVTKRTITLTTGAQPSGRLFTLGVSGVRDRTAQQNLIPSATTVSFASPALANGGFESGENGWSMSGSYLVFDTSDPYIASEGNAMVVLNGAQTPPNAVISQTFATVPGQTYVLEFDYGILALNGGEQHLGVELIGASSLLAKTESLLGNSQGNSVWTSSRNTFVADSGTATLTFRDLSYVGDGLDLLLDNVKVTAVPNNLLANGSFESGETGWSMSGNYLVYDAEPPYAAVDGAFTMVLNGGQTTPTAVLSQSFATEPGRTYQVDFRVGILALNSGELVLGMDIGGNAPLLSRTASLSGNGQGDSVWTARSHTFTADSTTTTLTFRDLSPTADGRDLLLDDVRVSAVETFSAGNTAPIAAGDSYETNQGVALVVPANGVLGNDSDAQSDPLTAVVDSLPAHGSLTLNPDGGFNYTPASGYSGADSFTYHANDGALDSNIVTVNLTVKTVNTAPVAVAESYSTNMDTPLVIAAAGVLTNDSDPQSDALTAVLDAGPSHGSLVLNPNGGFTYTPASGFSGADSFTYHANDGSLDSNVVIVSITVIAPVSNVLVNGSFESSYAGWTATGNQGIEFYAGTNGVRLVAFNGRNLTPDGVLTQSFATVPGQTYTVQFDVGVLSYVSKQQKLQVSVTGNGGLLSQNVTLNGTGNGTIRWTAKTYTFVANSTTSTLSFRDKSTTTTGIDWLLDNVRVNGPPAFPNSAPVAIGDSYSINQNTTLVVQSPGVLSNDVDPQSADLTAVLERAPGSGSLTLNPNGSFSYRPDSGFTGEDSFTYHSNDGALDSNTVTVKLTVKAVAAGLLVNPSFESDFTAWTKSGNQNIMTYPATDGVKLVTFNGDNLAPDGVLSQTFATTPGKTYNLTFDLSVLAYTTDVQRMKITATGAAGLLSQTITLTGNGGGLGPWLPQAFAFTADSAATTLEFRDLSTATIGIDLLLDNVRVLEAQAPAASIAPPQETITAVPSLSITPGEAVIRMTAPQAGEYVLERSENLKDWLVIDSMQCDANEPIEFHDIQETPKPRMFYRIGYEPVELTD